METYKYNLLRNRLAVLEGNGKNIKSGGVVRKIKRQLRAVERLSSFIKTNLEDCPY